MGRTVFAVFALMLAILLVGGFCIGQRVEQLESASNSLSLPIPEAAAIVGQPDTSDEQLAQLALATRQTPAAGSSPVLSLPESSAVASASPDLTPPSFPSRPTRRVIFIQHSENYPDHPTPTASSRTMRPLLLSRLALADIELALLIKLDTVVNLDLEPPTTPAHLGNPSTPSTETGHNPM